VLNPALTLLEREHVDILLIVLQIVLGITSLLLTMLILLHKGAGGGMSGMFGGGMSSNLKSSGVAERNLNMFTVIIGAVWFIDIVMIGLLPRFA
jgi:preprotein translocase subunit SecG